MATVVVYIDSGKLGSGMAVPVDRPITTKTHAEYVVLKVVSQVKYIIYLEVIILSRYGFFT